MTLKPGLWVTQGHRNQHVWFVTYDFLLTFHSKHGPILYRFQSKIAKFSHPCIFCALLMGFPLELGTGTLGQKTRTTGLLGRERSLMISAVWTQSTMTDRRMDGWTDTGRQQRPRLHIVSLSKNVLICLEWRHLWQWPMVSPITLRSTPPHISTRQWNSASNHTSSTSVWSSRCWRIS